MARAAILMRAFLNPSSDFHIEKTDILKSLASMYKNAGSQIFRITTGKQSGPNVFDKLRLVMTFSTNLGVTEVLCSFRLVLEEKAGMGQWMA